MNLTRKYWPSGWQPDQDRVNGDPNALLRADNLCYDEEGVLSLARGTLRVNDVDFGFNIHTVYSKMIRDSKFRFIGMSDARVIYTTDGNTWWNFLNDGSATRCSFTSGLGHVYCFSGNERKKLSYDGSTVFISDITPEQPASAPTVVEAAKNDFFFVTTDFSGFTLIEGSSLVNDSNYLEVTADGFHKRAIVEYTPGTPWDSMSLGAGGEGTPEDVFLFVVRVSETTALKSIRVTFNLGDSWAPLTDYYWYEWENPSEGSAFNAGTDAWTVLKCLRQDFTREGTTEAVGWSDVKSMRVTIVGSSNVTIRMGENGVVFTGFNENPLNGLYEYIQVNVNNTGAGIFKSKPSPASLYVDLVGGRALITPVAPTDPQVNEIWFYRRDVTWMQDVRPITEPRRLDKWYRVEVLDDDLTSAFEDHTSDMEALILNQTYPVDPWSVSEYTDDEIIAVSDPFNGRLLLVGRRDIYITYEDDFGLYSPLWTLRLSGDSTEKNLWIKNISNNQVLVGTTRDVYEISGTLQELPDWTLDVRITPLGVQYPPIHEAVAEDHNAIFYIASDGIRLLNGSTSQIISAPLSLLFTGVDRHGVAPINKQVNNYGTYALAVSQGKMFFTSLLTDDSRKTFVYDIKRQMWWLWTQGPNYLFREEDDTLIGGFGGSSPAHLRVMYFGTEVDAGGQAIDLITVSDDNGQPRNRKDTFTLKITADTGNDPVTIYIAKDAGSYTNLGEYSFNGISEKLIELATPVGLGFRFALRIVSSSLTTFRLYNYTIEYDPRPEQLNYLRIPNNNLGTASRKRFITHAHVIDTLGNAVTYTPLIDGVAGTTSTANLDRKGTHIHFFTTDTTGIDVGGIFQGTAFEYYGPNMEETVSEKIPPQTKFYLIPGDDYGTPNRKRHSSYKFQINTSGADVRFTPRIDGVDYAPATFNTTEKRTVEYFFDDDTIGIDIGGTLETLADTPFEFYGVIKPQEIEVLPPRLTYFRIPENNYGVPAKKRVRTMPMEINTNGQDVTFTPIVDGVAGDPSTFNTSHRQTVLHYFTTDSFGVDYSGELEGASAFEFYGLLQPVDVEVLPVGKKFDQVGPLELDRLGKLLGFRVRLLHTSTSLPFTVYMNDVAVWSGSIPTVANVLKNYEVMRVPKTLSGTSIRIEFGPSEVFHRYWVKVRVNTSGNSTDNKEIPVQ
jgi:hypothetical protein